MNETAVTTGKARLSYEHLFALYTRDPNQDPKYSVTVIIPKSDIATKSRIDAAIAAATQSGIAKCWNGVKPPIVAIPVYDGDGVRPNGDPFGEECKGCWVFTASSKKAPQVVDLGLNPIINASEVYSGCYARVNVNFFPYNSNGKRGIGCGLNCVQKLEDGEPLGGGVSAAEAFGVPMAISAAPAPTQPYQQGYPTAPAHNAYYGGIDPITGMPYGG